jgi:hypothetical protein
MFTKIRKTQQSMGRWARLASLLAAAAASVTLAAPTPARADNPHVVAFVGGSLWDSNRSNVQSFRTPLGISTGTEAPGPRTDGMFSTMAKKGCIAVHSTPTSFTASIQWTTLVARTHPFQACPVTGEWHRGDGVKIKHFTDLGQKICLHPTTGGTYPGSDNRASTVWYSDGKGWFWSGGTSMTNWNTVCR